MDTKTSIAFDYVKHWADWIKDEDILSAADTIQAEQIVDDRLRSKILDMQVNLDVEARIIVQRCVGAFEDGGFGPETLMLVNSSSTDALLWKLAQKCVAIVDLLQGTNEEHLIWRERARTLGRVGITLPQGT